MDQLQIILLNLFLALSLGLAAWSVLALNEEARSGAFKADEDFAKNPLFRALRPYIQTLGRRLEGMGALAKLRADLKDKLVSAGKAEALSAGEFLAIQLFSLFGGTLIGIYFALMLEETREVTRLVDGVRQVSAESVYFLEMIPVCAIVGFVLPLINLKDQIARRQRAIRRVLPYALDLLTLAVEAGLDFTAALQRIAQKLGGNPLHDEVQRLVRDLQMGKTRREGLKDLGERVALDDLKLVLGALIQADELGSSLGPTLRIQAAEMRRKRFDRAEKAAMEAPVKLLFPLVVFIFPLVFLVVFSPLAIKLYLDSPF